MSYSVLFREFPLDQLDALAPLVRQAYGIADFDARAKLRRGWGIIERGVGEESAQRVVAALGDAVVVIDDAQLRPLNDPQVLTGGQMTENGFIPQLQNPQDETRLFDWSEIQIVAAGGFSEEVLQRETGGNEKSAGKMMMGLGVFLVTGVPLGLFGGGKKKEEKPRKSNRLITFGRIVTKAGEQFAFSPDHFDFSALGANKQLNAGANLRALLAEFRRLTPTRLNLGARLLLDNKSLTLANYTGLQEFETELLWLFNLPSDCSGAL